MTGDLAKELDDLGSTLAALNELADGALQEEAGQAHRLAERVRTRRKFAPHTLVVALAGTTGAGKSSLFNALTGAAHATVGVRRPTTTSPGAAIFGAPEQGTGALLDWLEISDRYTVTSAPHDLGATILIDLPDIDSIANEHRYIAEHFIQNVDVVLWVVDPEKYADARLHENYLRPLATHASVMEVVINQVDRLSTRDAQDAAADLRAKLLTAGIDSGVLTTSTTTGAGLTELAGRLRARAEAKEDQHRRLRLDTAAFGEKLARMHPYPPDLPARGERALAAYEAGVIDAVGLRSYANAGAAAHHHALLRKTAWPPLRAVHRGRRTPPVPELRTTFLPEPGAHLSAAFVGPGGWLEVLRHSATRSAGALQRELSTYRPPISEGEIPRWSRPMALLQWLGITLLVGALIVFGVEAGIRYFGITLPPALSGVPAEPGYPTLPPLRWSVAIAVSAVVVSLVVSALGAVMRSVSRSRYRRRVQAQVTRHVSEMVTETVASPLRGLLDEGQKYSNALTKITPLQRTNGSQKVRRVKN